MKRVVGMGACVYDTLIYCPHYPREDTKLKAQSILVSAGGPAANALAVMSGLGVKTQIIGCFADDEAGRYILADFEKFGVDTSKAVTVKNTRSFCSYIVLSLKDKTRTCVFDRGTVPDAPEALDLSAIDGASVLHLDGNYIESALKCANYARKNGVKVSLDAGGLYEKIETLLPLTDILIPSAEFALGITGKNSVADAAEALYEKYRPEVLAVTDGSRGGYYIDSGKVRQYVGIKTDAVDTNGAGDTFHGAFIAEYLRGADTEKCCAFASAAAALKCTKKGVRGVLPDRVGVENFLASKLKN